VRDMLTTKQVCELLGVDQRTLRKYESADGRWCTLFGTRFRVYRLGNEPHSQRRYHRDEVMRIVERIRCPW
jgi:predicted site-specific integrase-resolvase